jgi:hypothetical protein
MKMGTVPAVDEYGTFGISQVRPTTTLTGFMVSSQTLGSDNRGTKDCFAPNQIAWNDYGHYGALGS